MEFPWSVILVLTPSPVEMGLGVSVLWVLALGGISGWGVLIGCGYGIVLAETSLFLMLRLPHSQIIMRSPWWKFGIHCSRQLYVLLWLMVHLFVLVLERIYPFNICHFFF
ncbi:hypothetical protein AHAS_Ahas02G0139300 [Arachis hypogaea]